MNSKPQFKRLGQLLLASSLLLVLSCNVLKTNVDRVDLAEFRTKNQQHLDELLRNASRSAALGLADTAEAITQSLIIGLKGSMDTLDPDFQKLKLKLEELGNLSEDNWPNSAIN